MASTHKLVSVQASPFDVSAISSMADPIHGPAAFYRGQHCRRDRLYAAAFQGGIANLGPPTALYAAA